MAFLMNTWYCAGWAHELEAENMIARKILGQSVLMYRKLDGVPVAINNRCPHRFAPLNQGERVGDSVACPYHGLEFGPTGECTRNPHGDCKIPKAARVPAYQLVERWGALWIWMGDADKADPAQIPDFSATVPREGWSTVYGHHTVAAEYQLVVDNLLDRSHVQYLHPILKVGANKPEGYTDEQRTEQIDDVVWDFHSQKPCVKVPFLAVVWPDAPEFTEHYFNLRWEAPGNMLLDSGIVALDSDRKIGAHLPMANLVTPADENLTHYFWNQARDVQVGNKMVDEKVKMGVSKTFAEEDGKMVVDCLELMGTSDLFSLNPVLLPGDAASVRARRIMKARIQAEAAGA